MKKKLLVGLAIAAFGALLGQVVQIGANIWFKTRAQSVLVKEASAWNPSTLPPAIQRQLTYVPVNYILRHSSGAPADRVTIFVKSDMPLSVPDVTFTPESEAHQVSISDPHTIRIDVPEIRPNCQVNCTVVTTNTAHLAFTEVSADAKIIESKDVAAQDKMSAWKETLIVTGIVLFWLAGAAVAVYVFWRVGKHWNDSEAREVEYNRKLVIGFIMGLLLYQLVLSSLGPLGMWLPLPRIGFDELTGAFIFFLVVTRYRLVEAWIKSHTKKDPAAAAAIYTESTSIAPGPGEKINVEKPAQSGKAAPPEKAAAVSVLAE